MHIPDGFISPEITAASWVAVGTYGWIAHKKLRKTIEADSTIVPRMASTAAFIFAAQMLNFPIAAGTSGHFLGASFATLVFGLSPWVAFLVMSVVLTIQAVFFGDGGVLALAVNILAMGIVSPWCFYGVYRLFRSSSLGVGVASWFSVVFTSAVVGFLLGLSGTTPLVPTLVAMTGVHSLIGVGEALITLSAWGFVNRFEKAWI